MSEAIESAVKALNEKLGAGGYDGVAKFVVEGEGTVMVDRDGARAADEDADVTLTADLQTFRAMMDGGLDPTTAFMQGRLSVDGDMSQAMQLGAALG